MYVSCISWRNFLEALVWPISKRPESSSSVPVGSRKYCADVEKRPIRIPLPLPEIGFIWLPEAVGQGVDRLAVGTSAPLNVGVELLHSGRLRLPVAVHACPTGIDPPLVQKGVAIQAVPLEFVPPLEKR